MRNQTTKSSLEEIENTYSYKASLETNCRMFFIVVRVMLGLSDVEAAFVITNQGTCF